MMRDRLFLSVIVFSLLLAVPATVQAAPLGNAWLYGNHGLYGFVYPNDRGKCTSHGTSISCSMTKFGDEAKVWFQMGAGHTNKKCAWLVRKAGTANKPRWDVYNLYTDSNMACGLKHIGGVGFDVFPIGK